MAVGRFRGRPLVGHRRVGHGRPRFNFRESMATPCHKPMAQKELLSPKKLSTYSPSVLKNVRVDGVEMGELNKPVW
jgi:hypothetical protein